MTAYKITPKVKSALNLKGLLLLLLLIPLISPKLVGAENKTLVKKNKVDLTYYFDSRNYNTLNLTTSIPELPLLFNIWGFVDISSEQNNSGQRFDLTRYFIEYRLRRPLFPNANTAWQGLGFELEYNDSNGSDNTVLRAGLIYKHPIPFLSNNKSWLQWRYHPYETDGSGSQISVIYFFHISKRISITGFTDLNLENGFEDRWVSEPQINYKINKTFDLVLETRFNEFEDANTTLDGFGVAGGIKIKF